MVDENLERVYQEEWKNGLLAYARASYRIKVLRAGIFRARLENDLVKLLDLEGKLKVELEKRVVFRGANAVQSRTYAKSRRDVLKWNKQLKASALPPGHNVPVQQPVQPPYLEDK